MHESYQNAITARPAISPRRRFEQRRRFVESVSVRRAGRRSARAGQCEDGRQILARAQIAAADGDALEDGVDQRQFVSGDGDADQHQRAVAAQRAEGLRNGGRRGGEDDGRIHAARLRRRRRRRRRVRAAELFVGEIGRRRRASP